jgi:hypothetical protein
MSSTDIHILVQIIILIYDARETLAVDKPIFVWNLKSNGNSQNVAKKGIQENLFQRSSHLLKYNA